MNVIKSAKEWTFYIHVYDLKLKLFRIPAHVDNIIIIIYFMSYSLYTANPNNN